MERLQRILAARGVSSRRNAEELIRAGRVNVDGVVVTELGSKADPIRSVIRVDGKVLKPQRPRYILLNKPRGYITTVKDERDRRTVMDLVEIPERVYPVGRLDRDTEGLLLLTNDGDVANRVMHPRYELDKEYQVLTLSRPTEATLQRVRDGLVIEGKRIVPEEVRIVRESAEGLILKIVVHEGVNHLVRRMMDSVGIPVERLRRIRVGPLSVTAIQPGAWREMTHGEVKGLLEALHLDLAERDRFVEPRGPRTPRKGVPGSQSRPRAVDPLDQIAPIVPVRREPVRDRFDRPRAGDRSEKGRNYRQAPERFARGAEHTPDQVRPPEERFQRRDAEPVRSDRHYTPPAKVPRPVGSAPGPSGSQRHRDDGNRRSSEGFDHRNRQSFAPRTAPLPPREWSSEHRRPRGDANRDRSPSEPAQRPGRTEFSNRSTPLYDDRPRRNDEPRPLQGDEARGRRELLSQQPLRRFEQPRDGRGRPNDGQRGSRQDSNQRFESRPHRSFDRRPDRPRDDRPREDADRTPRDFQRGTDRPVERFNRKDSNLRTSFPWSSRRNSGQPDRTNAPAERPVTNEDQPHQGGPRGRADGYKGPQRGPKRGDRSYKGPTQRRYQDEQPQQRQARDNDSRSAQTSDRDRRSSGGRQNDGRTLPRKPRRRDLP